MTNWNRVGSDESLMKMLWWFFLKGTEEKHKKFGSGQSVSRPSCEPGAPRIQLIKLWLYIAAR